MLVLRFREPLKSTELDHVFFIMYDHDRAKKQEFVKQ